MLQGQFQDHAKSVRFVLLRCEPTKHTVRVVDTFHEIGKGNALAAFSLREVMTKTDSLVAVNAGSTASYSLPIPVGLLVTRARVIAPINPQPRDSGFLCVAGNRLVITGLSGLRLENCSYAVQRGPVIDRASAHLGIDWHLRTVIAIDTQQRLLILVTRDPATLNGIAAFLYAPSSDLNVQSALNMDGDASSGLLIAPQLKAVPSEVGNVDGLVASAIAVCGK
jgi:exopolysaccharide biosynthesis protein